MLTISSFTRKLVLAGAAATLAGCASMPLMSPNSWGTRLANHDSPAEQGADSCQTAIAAPSADSDQMLDSQSIDLFVWNMQKGWNPEVLTDLERLARDKDLVLIQEARLELQPVTVLDEAQYWSFAPGYETPSASTGVMTLSQSKPLTHCQMSDVEPWLRSPKAISVTRFGLDGSDQTLAVINVHGLNFTFGVTDFERQILKIESVLSSHNGPVILAGDFNTWRKRRIEILTALTERLDMNELSFDVDHRVTPMGNVVDRIFVRGLTATDASTEVVDTSDHNPMSVTLRM